MMNSGHFYGFWLVKIGQLVPNFYGSQQMQKSLIKHVLDWLMVKHLGASD